MKKFETFVYNLSGIARARGFMHKLCHQIGWPLNSVRKVRTLIQLSVSVVDLGGLGMAKLNLGAIQKPRRQPGGRGGLPKNHENPHRGEGGQAKNHVVFSSKPIQ